MAHFLVSPFQNVQNLSTKKNNNEKKQNQANKHSKIPYFHIHNESLDAHCIIQHFSQRFDFKPRNENWKVPSH